MIGVISDLKQRFLRWYAERTPAKALRLLSMPIDHQLKTSDFFRYERARMLETAFGFAANNQIGGDYTEFGVFEGTTFIHALKAAERYRLPMRFHAFDSFQGLPPIQGIDAGGEFTAGQYAATQEVFAKSLRRNHVDGRRVTVTDGFFSDTLTAERASALELKAVAIAWVDCDLYESTVPVLEFLSPLLVDGSVLCFDDWFCYRGRPDRGEQRACAEWLGRERQFSLSPYHKFHWAGQSFIVHVD